MVQIKKRKVHKMSLEIKRGDIVKCYLPGEGNSHVQSGYRPVVVVQNNTGNKFSPNTIVVPLTSESKKDMPTHSKFVIHYADREDVNNIALCEALTTIPISSITSKVGHVNYSNMQKIEQAIRVSLGLNS